MAGGKPPTPATDPIMLIRWPNSKAKPLTSCQPDTRMVGWMTGMWIRMGMGIKDVARPAYTWSNIGCWENCAIWQDNCIKRSFGTPEPYWPEWWNGILARTALGHSTPNCQCHSPFAISVHIRKVPKLRSHFKNQAKVTRPSGWCACPQRLHRRPVPLPSSGNRCSRGAWNVVGVAERVPVELGYKSARSKRPAR